MKENYQKSDYSETWLEGGIIIQHINPDVKEINLKIARQLIQDRKLACGSLDREVSVIVYTNNAINIDKEAKEFYDSPEPYNNIKAIAMIMDNFIAAFVARLVFMVKRNQVPTEVFNNHIKAMKWLEKYQD
jgi:hypothetical protein